VKSNNTIVCTQEWFKLAVPEPMHKNVTTQLGVHLEEVDEMLEELTGNTHNADTAIKLARDYLQYLSSMLKKKGEDFSIADHRKEKLLDALCDQVVTAIGVGTFMGMDVPSALDEVNRSNFSKFEDGMPLFDENKKVIKGSNYSKPNLKPFV